MEKEGHVTSVSVTVTVPGNTLAQVCVPIYLCTAPTMVDLVEAATITLDGVPVTGALEGGMLCLPHDVGGSNRVVTATC